jgi:hypothetical protein
MQEQEHAFLGCCAAIAHLVADYDLPGQCHTGEEFPLQEVAEI